ncbi:small subunit ribosomal protein S15 [Fistulifera solaris]|uniref:30S ribosomal protein S15 n=1 Tax=Fistulifera solaris TaxID=1519565 RepID=A0A1Z5K200_FISSO|nr:small subunit ribosomal protein S15 [Fistulifera solaris]|eukprot:GAX20189.1 small subunit ribosomal protein S15 [Fistulifera solaris]
MKFSSLVLLASIGAVSAFTPSLPSSKISSVIQETQRFQPLAAEFDDDEEEQEKDDYIELEGMEDGDVELINTEPPAWAVSAEKVQALREKHRLHDKDTGSPEYQVAGMTERISYLTSHLQMHPKDFSTRRGLVALVNKRRRLLNYLSTEDVDRYKALIASLGIRHKAPGTVPSREETYARFPKQKAARKHLVKKN